MFVQRISRFCYNVSSYNSQTPIRFVSASNQISQRLLWPTTTLCAKFENLSVTSANDGFIKKCPEIKDNYLRNREHNLMLKRNLILQNQISHLTSQKLKRQINFVSRDFHTSNACSDIMEFFDNEEYWGAQKVRVGRSWLKEELRLKSNEDLHKLWYILLKERNMLLTMEHAYKEAVQPMPNEERIDKVQESMENLEEVVRERNRAYFELEAGVSGERERVIRQGPFGLPVGYMMREHTLPWKMNSSYRKMLRHRFATGNSNTVKRFMARYMAKIASYERWDRMKQMRRCANVLKRFPDSDDEALQEKFPLVDIQMVKRWKKVLGHHNNHQYDVHVNRRDPYGNKK